VAIELPLSVGIPQSYIPADRLRLQLYRRIADTINEEDIDRIREEFTDRFGPLPQETANLFWQLSLKLKAELCGLSSITVEGDQIVLRYPALPEGIKARDLADIGGDIRRGKNAYWMPVRTQNGWQERLSQALDRLVGLTIKQEKRNGIQIKSSL
jgi:transcription-repair coupling factor (superfamily II helicase)